MDFRTDCHSFIYLTKDQIPARARCDVPETIRRATWFPISPCIGLGLHCLPSCLGSGGLLPHLFNLAFARRRYVFCCTCRELALTQAPPVFTGNPALRCPDFPLFEQMLEQRMTASRKLIVGSEFCPMNISESKDLRRKPRSSLDVNDPSTLVALGDFLLNEN